ncbi:hypothetical protein [Solibacillus sp. CAU 1738]|uniref:hypothetical protein n=1 Tax=Solibacillus sp. CAU 1738 TaxID=3140363 RepID=UPI00326186E3
MIIVFKLCEVKIWDKQLKCDVCENGQWYFQTMKIEIEDYPIQEQVRYLFECKTCGNCKIFAMVASEDDMDDLNIKCNFIDEEY